MGVVDIRIFIQRFAVEVTESVTVLDEMHRNHVEDNADVLAVAFVDEFHQILALAITGSTAEITTGLISPAAVERMFVQRHQLNVRKTMLLDVRNQLLRQLAVA